MRKNWKITEVVIDGDSFEVETWWDRQSRNWITQLKTPSGYQIGDAIYVYQQSSAKRNQEQMVKDAPGIVAEELELRTTPFI